jgi:threonine aldolase
MANQLWINVHTTPGDEVVCDVLSHIYNYEGGGIARHSGASVRLLAGDRGRFTGAAVRAAVNPGDAHYARTALVAVEDTVNKGGGAVWSAEALADVSAACRDLGLPLHLDGARAWNALVATGKTGAAESEGYGGRFDSLSVCFSKGLGAPVGSVLVGSKPFIAAAHRARKAFGGGMRQVGVLAAAGLYALDHEWPRLEEDHRHAATIAECLAQHPDVSSVDPVETNIVIFDVRTGVTGEQVVEKLDAHDVKCFAFGPQKVRLVTHRDLRPAAVDRLLGILRSTRF